MSYVGNQLARKIAKRLPLAKLDSEKKISFGGLGSIFKPKEGGGLGVHPLKQVNNALLGKWLWRVGEDSSSMWKSIMEAKYGVAGNGWDLGDQRY